jgi:3'(2'), 5'-bisphosphate nucleotidase
MNLIDADFLARELLPAVLQAGRIEMNYFTSGVAVEAKADRSPVTAADREAEAVVLQALARIAPEVPVIAEEAFNAGYVPEIGRRFFLVDALDGTSGFIKGKPEFSVNIGLIEAGKPVFGLIYVPPTGALYVTRSDGSAHHAVIAPDSSSAHAAAIPYAQLTSRAPDRANLLAFNSRTAGGAGGEFLALLNVRDSKPLGSSQKFCLIAEGKGDVYVRFGNTNEWDTAAGQAILEAAGGCVTTIDGKALSYGKSASRFLNPHFVAWGRAPLLTSADGIFQAKSSEGA